MLMNKFEFAAMNNPIRAFIQDVIEAKTLRNYTDLPKNKVVLRNRLWKWSWDKINKKIFFSKRNECHRPRPQNGTNRQKEQC